MLRIWRLADALWQIFQDAANAEGSVVSVGFCHNIKWSAEAYEAMIDAIDTNQAPAVDVDIFRCESSDGIRVNPTEAAISSLFGQVRRLVVDANSVVIDPGRARCFTGNARHAATATQTSCMWPGGYVPPSRQPVRAAAPRFRRCRAT